MSLLEALRKNKFMIIVLTLPGLLIYTVFIIVPLFITLGGGFFESDMISASKFVGLANYKELFSDRMFGIALKNTIVCFILHIILGIIPVVIVGALLQNVHKRLQTIMTSMFLYPLVLSVVVIAKMWVQIFNPDMGLINTMLTAIGLGNIHPLWLNDRRYALLLVTFVALWHWFGYGVIIIFAGIKSIPIHYMEAAHIDGANGLHMFFKITLPLLAEKLKIIFIIYFVGGITTFTHNMIMTNGGPGTASTTMLLYVYNTVFSAFRFGYGIAMSSIVLIICLLLCVLINKFIAREKIEL